MKQNVWIIICAVVLTLLAAFIGLWIDNSGMLAVVFAVTVMGGFILYAVLCGGKKQGDAEKTDETRTVNNKPGKQD